MDRQAYERVKRHFAEVRQASEVKPESPPPERNTREWAQARMRAKQREIDEIRRLAFEPREWSDREQEAVAEIAASSHEPSRDRTAAIHLMATWKRLDHANLLVSLLADPRTDSSVRYAAAWTLGGFGRREMLLPIYDLIKSVEPPPKFHTASLYDACVYAIFVIAAHHGFVDEQKYDPPRASAAPNEVCRRWWDQARPTEQMILDWSQGRKPPEGS